MPLGVFQAERFLKACSPKFSEFTPTGRGQVGVGRIAVGYRQVGPVIEGGGNQGVGTGDDRCRHRRADLGEREVIVGLPALVVVVPVVGRANVRRNVGTLYAGAAKSVVLLRLTPAEIRLA